MEGGYFLECFSPASPPLNYVGPQLPQEQFVQAKAYDSLLKRIYDQIFSLTTAYVAIPLITRRACAESERSLW